MKMDTRFTFTIEDKEWNTLALTARLLRGIVQPLSLHRSEMNVDQENFLIDANDTIISLENLLNYIKEFGE